MVMTIHTIIRYTASPPPHSHLKHAVASQLMDHDNHPHKNQPL